MTKSAAKSAGIAILGALAYDRIATTKRPFGASGPGLNSKVSASSEHFGGCGGNIVYHLAQLQQPALLVIKGKRILRLGDFFHQLHHRFYECNYGTAEIGMDRLHNSFHDGQTPPASLTKARK